MGNAAAYEGDAITDADIYLSGQRNDIDLFIDLYGVRPETAAELGKAPVTPFIFVRRLDRLNQRRAGWPAGLDRGSEHHGHPEVQNPRETNKRHTERSQRGILRVDKRPRKPYRRSNTHHQCSGRFFGERTTPNEPEQFIFA